jgi:hypothetical protein
MSETTFEMMMGQIVRCVCIVAGLTIVYLGYRLFSKGVFEATNVSIENGKGKIKLQNAAPGTVFALFGACFLIFSVSTTFARVSEHTKIKLSPERVAFVDTKPAAAMVEPKQAMGCVPAESATIMSDFDINGKTYRLALPYGVAMDTIEIVNSSEAMSPDGSITIAPKYRPKRPEPKWNPHELQYKWIDASMPWDFVLPANFNGLDRVKE